MAFFSLKQLKLTGRYAYLFPADQWHHSDRSKHFITFLVCDKLLMRKLKR